MGRYADKRDKEYFGIGRERDDCRAGEALGGGRMFKLSQWLGVCYCGMVLVVRLQRVGHRDWGHGYFTAGHTQLSRIKPDYQGPEAKPHQ
jgi:hypothetical protein